ncbi:hypothetical protein BKA70DRAFT_1224284 [Coprinopsis sp. MPI-PUGE-AT-0042]|nr:hypothetical protein BKA70DRAFT_1224284 [Coprinopsis sp. MPI-PUGE-AT-0042]
MVAEGNDPKGRKQEHSQVIFAQTGTLNRAHQPVLAYLHCLLAERKREVRDPGVFAGGLDGFTDGVDGNKAEDRRPLMAGWVYHWSLLPPLALEQEGWEDMAVILVAAGAPGGARWGRLRTKSTSPSPLYIGDLRRDHSGCCSKFTKWHVLLDLHWGARASASLRTLKIAGCCKNRISGSRPKRWLARHRSLRMGEQKPEWWWWWWWKINMDWREQMRLHTYSDNGSETPGGSITILERGCRTPSYFDQQQLPFGLEVLLTLLQDIIGPTDTGSLGLDKIKHVFLKVMERPPKRDLPGEAID